MAKKLAQITLGEPFIEFPQRKVAADRVEIVRIMHVQRGPGCICRSRRGRERSRQ
jgi:hypothetical protein